MTIVAVTKIQMNRMLEAATPPAAGNGEFVFTTDSARLVLGPDPKQGNQNTDRSDRFPYQNQEVLTESSPRNKELFSLFVRNQDDNDFHPPSIIPNGVGFTNVMTRDDDGGLEQEILLGGAFNSAFIEYHAYVPGYYNSFYHGVGNPTLSPPAPTLIQSGVVRIMTDANGVVVSNNTSHTVTLSNAATYSTLEFGVESTLDGYIVQAQNTYSAPVMLRLRKTIISIGTAGAPQQEAPQIQPPVWLTLAGSIGTYWQGNAVSYQLVAVDPQGLPLVFSLESGNLSSAGLSMSSGGIISGTISGSASFTVDVTNGSFTVPRSFTISEKVLSPPVWVTPAGNIGLVYQGNSVSIQLVATDPNGLPLTFTQTTGSLSNALAVQSNGVVDGVVGNVGISNLDTFTVRASDGVLYSDRTFTLTEKGIPNAPPIWQTANALGTFPAGQPMTDYLVAIDPGGYTVVYSLTAGSLPPGMTFNNTTGQLSGTPELAGSYSITASASNGRYSATRVFTFTIGAYFAPMVVQTAAQIGTGLINNSVVLPHAPTAGNTLIAFFQGPTNFSNTGYWEGLFSGPSPSNMHAYYHYVQPGESATLPTFPYVVTNSVTYAATVWEVSGVSSTLTQTFMIGGDNYFNPSRSSAMASFSYTTTASNALVLAGIAGTATTIPTISSVVTTPIADASLSNSALSLVVAGAHYTVAAQGTSVNAEVIGWTGNAVFDIAIIALKPGSGIY